mmetsp:Transcript_9273/g.22779  ORF Transcript_9273/g.22779 Transcript_9273/m.22779 type:complete len:131 (+) Transcript_9273:587-979(+)
MHASVLKDEAANFGLGVGGASPQVGYPALEELALSDRSHLGVFMRSLCCGDGTLPADAPVDDPDVAVLYGTVESKKNVMASFVASQVLPSVFIQLICTSKGVAPQAPLPCFLPPFDTAASCPPRCASTRT